MSEREGFRSGGGHGARWSRVAMIALIASSLLVSAGFASRAASSLSFLAKPNPAVVGERVLFTVSTRGSEAAPEQLWIAAVGLGRPTFGDLPPGTWAYECCPAQTGYGPAWHYGSYGPVPPGVRRFTATTRQPGTYTNAAALGSWRATLTVRVLRRSG